MLFYDMSGNSVVVGENIYDCTKYGITTDSNNNTSAFNALIQDVYNSGGGIIYIPKGTYIFDSASASAPTAVIRTLLRMKSRVSVRGESLTDSILKVVGNSAIGTCLFAQSTKIPNDETLKGCTFENFTVDMSECTMTEYSSTGKAFMGNDLEDCIFRDLRLIGCPSTALGIDVLKNVVIDSVYVYQGGRLWTSGGYGGAGIGIGTGNSGDENFIIRNCICDDCGNFGIFLENQVSHNIPSTAPVIIANNIVINGRGRGIGVRCNKNITITGNNVVNNPVGIYFDTKAESCIVSGNYIADNTAGVEFGSGVATGNGTDAPCSKIAITSNMFIGNNTNVLNTITPSNIYNQNNAEM